MDGIIKKRNSVHAYTEMMRAAKVFRTYGKSRFKIHGPNEDGLFLVETDHNFGNGLLFQSHWTLVEKGKELVAYKACKYFGFPNPYPVSWLVKSDVLYLQKQQQLGNRKKY